MNYIYASDTQDSFWYPDRFIYLTYDGERLGIIAKQLGIDFLKLILISNVRKSQDNLVKI